MAPITNPYAKKKRAPPSAAAPAASGVSDGGSKRPRSNNDKTQQKKQPRSGASLLAPSSSNDWMASERFSFSQAFAGAESSTNYMQSTPDDDAEDRAQQRAMDAATAASQNNKNNRLELTDQQIQEAETSANPHILYISPRQRGNAVLDYIRNVPKQYAKIVPDFWFSTTQCALFLSLKYHSTHPKYIHARIGELQGSFKLRILLVLVDKEDNASILQQLNNLAVLNRMTLILSWTTEEAARYLETFKAFQGKDASLIQKRTSTNYVDQVADFLTACSGINKSDAASLLGQFGSMRNLIIKGTPDELALVPGLGQVKVARLWEAFHKPLSKKAYLRRKQREKEEEGDETKQTGQEHEDEGEASKGHLKQEEDEEE